MMDLRLCSKCYGKTELCQTLLNEFLCKVSSEFPVALEVMKPLLNGFHQNPFFTRQNRLEILIKTAFCVLTR